jgi:Protein of unknown function (DUF669)
MPQYTAGVPQTVLPEGDYNFTVVDAGEKQSKSSGNTMIELQLEFVTDDFISSSMVYDNLVFTPKAFFHIDEFRVATGDTLVEGQTVSLEAEDCVDRRGRAHLIVDAYNGKTKNKVSQYLPPSAGKGAVPVTPVSPVTPSPAVPTDSAAVDGASPDPKDIPFACDRG